MTLNDLKRRNSPYFAFFSPISISLLAKYVAKYVAVVEYRPKLSVNIVSQFQVFHFWPLLTHPAARSLCDSWATCKTTKYQYRILWLILKYWDICEYTNITNPFVAVVALNSLLPWSDDLQTSIADITSLHKRYVHDDWRVFQRISGLQHHVCLKYDCDAPCACATSRLVQSVRSETLPLTAMSR